MRRFVNIFANDEDIRFLKNLETPVKDSDEISIVPAIAGGCIASKPPCVDVARYARHIALPEIGPEGQARISRRARRRRGRRPGRRDRATYLRAAGVGQVFERRGVR